MDFKKIFNGEALTLEQFLERTKDVKFADLAEGGYVAKGKYDADVKKANDALTEAKATIENLEKASDDTKALKDEIARYKAEEDKRKEAADKEAKDKANTERFNAVLGDKKFASDYTRKGVYADFVTAINDPANIGKGDADLFATLTKDKDGIFEAKHKDVNMGGFKSGNQGEHGGMTREQIAQIKDRDERRKAMMENWELYSTDE